MKMKINSTQGLIPILLKTNISEDERKAVKDMREYLNDFKELTIKQRTYLCDLYYKRILKAKKEVLKNGEKNRKKAKR